MAKQELKLDPTGVPMRLVDDQVGGLRETTEYWCRRLGCQVVKTWAGERALAAADAMRVVDAWRAAVDAHGDRWNAYQAWRVAEKERKARERAEAFAAQRAEAERIRDARRQRAVMEDIATHEAALAAAAEAQGPTFEEWSGGVTVLTDTPR